MSRNAPTCSLFACFVGMLLLGPQAFAEEPQFKKHQLTDKFYCEGAHYGDFNQDGKMDVVSGPYWYAGPDFSTAHEIYTPEPFEPKSYSKNFLCFTGDFNSDSWTDVFVVGFPGDESWWFENPKNQEGWPEVIAKEVTDNLHRFLANSYITVGRNGGNTILPLPPKDLQFSSHTSHLGKPDAVKDRVHIMENAVVTWTRQIKNILKLEPEQILKGNLNPGPGMEVEFWQNKAGGM